MLDIKLACNLLIKVNSIARYVYEVQNSWTSLLNIELVAQNSDFVYDGLAGWRLAIALLPKLQPVVPIRPWHRLWLAWIDKEALFWAIRALLPYSLENISFNHGLPTESSVEVAVYIRVVLFGAKCVSLVHGYLIPLFKKCYLLNLRRDVPETVRFYSLAKTGSLSLQHGHSAKTTVAH